ncbi:MAG: GNAT family N-acetyltransferase [Lachnospiraceae bacterium]|jgi:predicted acetyltransferase|nr:GNAT family N-acetyltransferase [Lachnospiraceae bacterium]
MIRYLKAEEKNRCLKLWREAFSEDSDAFCDYYFKEKTRDNRVLACEEDGRIVSMLHQNPYRIFLRGAEVCCDYIVGVATAVSERNKGHMRGLLLTALREMNEERMPFTFLMPARESLYRPYDFRYIFDQPRWVLRYDRTLKRVPGSKETLMEELADWQNAWLKRQYEVFAIRDKEYLARMKAELESEAGTLSLIYDGDWFVGMESEWGLGERELRYLYTGERYRTQVGKKPSIMGRIVCLPEFLRHIRLKKDCPQDEVSVEIGVHDLFIPANQGAWLWTLTKSGSRLTQESRFISQGKMSVFTIAELTQWLFGYETPKQADELPFGAYIEPFHGVFLDEVV